MFRQIVTPKNTQLTLHIPDDFVGHQVEVIAFTVEETEHITDEKLSVDKKNNRLMQFINSNPITLPKGYTFNRDELYE